MEEQNGFSQSGSQEVVKDAAVPIQTGPDSTPQQANTGQVEYAGFWVRYAALFIDGLILMIPNILVNIVFGKIIGYVFSYLLAWSYAIYMLTSKQATLGKMAVGLKVTTVDGNMIMAGKAALREIVGKFLDALTFGIGFLMVAFTEKKQGLHDKVAGTIVVYDPARKKRKWLVVVAIVCGILAPIILGFVIFTLTSLDRARQIENLEKNVNSEIPKFVQ